jgi:hypothetical protein
MKVLVMMKRTSGIQSPADAQDYFMDSKQPQWTCRLCGKKRSYGQLESHAEAAHFCSLETLTNDSEFVKSLYIAPEETEVSG